MRPVLPAPRPCRRRLRFGAAALIALAGTGIGFGQVPPGGPPEPPRPPDASAPDEANAAPPKDADKDKDKDKEEWYSVHAQGTVVSQGNWQFHSPYVGPNSFLPIQNYRTTETGTLYLDTRLWHGAELVFNPEISGGAGLSNTLGIAGFPNGEATRVGVPQPTPYFARLVVRQTFSLDGDSERVEAGPNQLAGYRDIDRITISVGKMAATDNFDDNRYSHDPRAQFLNWSLMYDGAWDYPANVRGYTYGGVIDFNTRYLALRYGVFAEPSVANGAEFDPHILKANGHILEAEERYELGDLPGKVREWAYLNHADMGKYREALEEMPVNPDITLTRAYRIKYGFGLNVEQALAKSVGVFARAGWNDGQSESWAFTEIDRTVQTGLQFDGDLWRRPKDEAGLALVVNGLSDAHRDYLAAGGLGFIIGDGRLRYSPEQIIEAYYNWELREGMNVSADVQGVNHPAYNADRGPVAVFGLRFHMAF